MVGFQVSLRPRYMLMRAELGLYGSEVTPDTFPLPTLGPKLQQVAVDIHRGRGFAVVRGLNPDEFSPEDNVLIFLGISSYIGAQRGRQDEEGNMLSESPDPSFRGQPANHVQCTSATRSSPRHHSKTAQPATHRAHQ